MILALHKGRVRVKNSLGENIEKGERVELGSGAGRGF